MFLNKLLFDIRQNKISEFRSKNSFSTYVNALIIGEVCINHTTCCISREDSIQKFKNTVLYIRNKCNRNKKKCQRVNNSRFRLKYNTWKCRFENLVTLMRMVGLSPPSVLLNICLYIRTQGRQKYLTLADSTMV